MGLGGGSDAALRVVALDCFAVFEVGRPVEIQRPAAGIALHVDFGPALLGEFSRLLDKPRLALLVSGRGGLILAAVPSLMTVALAFKHLVQPAGGWRQA